MSFIVGLFLPTVAYAQYHLTDSGWNCQGFLYCSGGIPANIVVVMTTKIVLTVSAFITALAVVVFIYGGIRMIVSQGQEGKEAGKKALIWASFGLAAAVLTGGIVAFVTQFIFDIA